MLRAEDSSGTQETDTGDDLCCYASRIADVILMEQLKREEGEHATSGSDEGERSDTRILARYLALQADEHAEKGSRHELCTPRGEEHSY